MYVERFALVISQTSVTNKSKTGRDQILKLLKQVQYGTMSPYNHSRYNKYFEQQELEKIQNYAMEQ